MDVDLDWLAQIEPGLQQYHDLLADDGVRRGLIGPREAPRLWDRHLRNCAAVADPHTELVPEQARIADIGSGAGLPGLVWALARPDCSVTLVEPLQRRTSFLSEVVTELGLDDRVLVLRGRAQDLPPLGVDVATSRALAPLSQVLRWSFPHLRPGGVLLAMKGSRASRELSEARETIDDVGGQAPEVVRIGPEDSSGHPLAIVVRVRKAARTASR